MVGYIYESNSEQNRKEMRRRLIELSYKHDGRHHRTIGSSQDLCLCYSKVVGIISREQ